MDNARFEALSRMLGAGTTRRGVVGSLAILAGWSRSEAIGKRHVRSDTKRERRHGGSGADADRKVTICHRTGSRKQPFQAIEVARSAVAAHEAHGDLVRCDDLNVIDVETCTCVCPPEAATQCQPNEVIVPELCRCVSRPDPVCTPVCSTEERCREVTVGSGGGGPGGSSESTYTTCCQYQSGGEILVCEGQFPPGGGPPPEPGTATFVCSETCPPPPSIPSGGTPLLQIDRVACDQTCTDADTPCGHGGTCVFSKCCNALICQPSCDKSRFV